MKIAISGGAGFVGSSLAHLFLAHHPKAEIYVFDNLRRRGSELNLPRFKKAGIHFVHGDIRVPADLKELPGTFDLFIEASAEPSVHAGTLGTSLQYVLDTNLVGTLNCLEFARQHAGALIFLSTSRVYSIPALRSIPLDEQPTRLAISNREPLPPGLSVEGISEAFPTVGSGFRSFYGSTKLASELFIEEYAANFNYPALINRCGVLAGPGQFGRTDQGVFTLWVARHLYGGALSYTGFGGQGKQVRDLLHPKDLYTLIEKQLLSISKYIGQTFSVGGGIDGSVSLLEYTKICEKVVGKSISVGSNVETAAVDVPLFVSNSQRAFETFQWKPLISPQEIVVEITAWLRENEELLKPLFV